MKEFMAPLINKDVRIHEDNEGAIERAKSRFSSRRTRHYLYVKPHIVRDAIERGLVCMEHVRS